MGIGPIPAVKKVLERTGLTVKDMHVIEVNETYERIDPKYRERRPVYTEAAKGYIVRLVDGKVWGPDTECGFVGVNGNLGPPKGKAIHYRRMGTYNPWARLADMDRDQLDVAVIGEQDRLVSVATRRGYPADGVIDVFEGTSR